MSAIPYYSVKYKFRRRTGVHTINKPVINVVNKYRIKNQVKGRYSQNEDADDDGLRTTINNEDLY